MTNAEKKVANAKWQHKASILALAVAVIVFLALSLLFDLPQTVTTVSLVVIAILSLTMGLTTMVVMVNKSPGAHPQE